MKERQSTKEFITEAEYYQALGLFTIGQSFTKRADEVAKALRELLGEKAEWGHCNDAVYLSRDFPELLKLLDLKVKRQWHTKKRK